MKKIPLTRNKFALVDDEDYEWLSKYKWYCSAKGYALRGFWIDGRVVKSFMAREIVKPAPGKMVDHINRNKLDNRRVNLRVATNRQNTWNSAARRNNKLGVKGVHKDCNRYVAQIGWGKTHKRIGSYFTLEEAEAAYKKAAKELYGEYAAA